MSRLEPRLPPVLVALGSLALFVTSLVGGPWSVAVFVTVAALFPVALIVLATHRRRTAPPGWLLAVLALLLAGGALGVLWLARGGAGERPVTGLPAGTLLMLVGLGALPLLLVGLGYALSFDRAHGRSDDRDPVR